MALAFLYIPDVTEKSIAPVVKKTKIINLADLKELMYMWEEKAFLSISFFWLTMFYISALTFI